MALLEDRKPVNCSCVLCESMCRITPCFGTPADIRKLIDAGHRDKLVGVMFPSEGTVFMLIAPQAVKDGRQLGRLSNGACVFLENGLCKLHDKDLKPIEGRLAHHSLPEGGLRREVCMTWVSVEGLRLLAEMGAGMPELLHMRDLMEARAKGRL